MRRTNLMARFFIYVFLGLLTLFFLSACEMQQPENIPQRMEKDVRETTEKTYTGYSDANEHGYAWAKVTVRGDDITRVELMEILSTGNEKDYEKQYREWADDQANQ